MTYSIAYSFNADNTILHVYGINKELPQTLIEITDNSKCNYAPAFSIAIPSLGLFKKGDVSGLLYAYLFNSFNVGKLAANKFTNEHIHQFFNSIITRKMLLMLRSAKLTNADFQIIENDTHYIDYNNQTTVPVARQVLAYYYNEINHKVEYYIVTSTSDTLQDKSVFIELSDSGLNSLMNTKVFNTKTNSEENALSNITHLIETDGNPHLPKIKLALKHPGFVISNMTVPDINRFIDGIKALKNIYSVCAYLEEEADAARSLVDLLEQFTDYNNVEFIN